MKHLKSLLLAFSSISLLAVFAPCVAAQSRETYQQMSAAQRAKFVSVCAREIASRISNTEYQFTPEFELDIQKSLDWYLERVSNSRSTKTDLSVVLQRAQPQAPTLMRVFKTRGVSPLLGLYIPWIESEYVNIQTPNDVGSIGMFQILASTGMTLGLTPDELLNVEKSADAAARYLTRSLKTFDSYSTKEALALLAYNRGDNSVATDARLYINDQNSSCGICVVAKQIEKASDASKEETYYVQRFFAAAIIGENPKAFGLQSAPLSSF
jgi:hypothetical protein